MDVKILYVGLVVQDFESLLTKRPQRALMARDGTGITPLNYLPSSCECHPQWQPTVFQYMILASRGRYEDFVDINFLRSMKIPLALTGSTWNVFGSMLTSDK